MFEEINWRNTEEEVEQIKKWKIRERFISVKKTWSEKETKKRKKREYDRSKTETSQLRNQELFPDISSLYSSDTQRSVLQGFIATFSPLQSRPPCCGGGLVQDLSLFWFPAPQLLVHEDQADHLDQRPRTGPGHGGVNGMNKIPDYLTRLCVTLEELRNFARALRPAIWGRGVITVSDASPHSSLTGSATVRPLAPLTPGSVHCNKNDY